MEHWGNNPNVIHGSIHTPSSFGSTINTRTKILSQVSSTFYVYSIVWDETKIDFLIDDVVFYTYNPSVKDANTWPFNKPQYLLLNIAMGGVGGAVDPTFTESSMEVDYVRVYQKGVLPPANTQTITFPSIPDQLISNPPFQLTALASSNLPVQYSTLSDKVILNGSTVTIVGTGRAVIKANQLGNSTISAAPEVAQSFCIKPVQPFVTTAGINTDKVTLTSNATTGNQWFKNGSAIPAATNATLLVSSPGVYRVHVVADDCVSDFSDEISIVITADSPAFVSTIVLYPNPVGSFLYLTGVSEQVAKATITNMHGHEADIVLTREVDVYRASTDHLVPGLYILTLKSVHELHKIKLIKR
jgi:beta-glucanase (GH16 family)